MSRSRTEDRTERRTAAPTLDEVVALRMSRRGVLGGIAALTALGAVGCVGREPDALPEAEGDPDGEGFAEVPPGLDDDHHVSPDCTVAVLVGWGDPVLPDAPAWDPRAQTAEAQAARFGFNCDFTAFLPLVDGARPASPDAESDHGLLCVNHEYTSARMMFPGRTERGGADDAALATVEMAAHGHSIVEVRRGAEGWQVVQGPRARRITAHTPFEVRGPAAGHALMRTKADPTGTRALGTLQNCSGGMTPWGTVLLGEENVDSHFPAVEASQASEPHHARYGIPAAGEWRYRWDLVDERFDVRKEPNEPNRFGWIVEIDPYDPASTPVKRTALGRFKHEGASIHVNADGRVVVYMGDDEKFEYVYRFVSKGRFEPGNLEANRHLLDEGTLSVARFDADGTVEWLPLDAEHPKLKGDPRFPDQGAVLVEARLAADALGATPMDRPEDIEANPHTGRVYAMLTNNTARGRREPDATGRDYGTNPANPTEATPHGRVVELVPPGDGTGDHTAERYTWSILFEGGPREGGTWLSSPDNAAVDADGHLWVATDGDPDQTGQADGLYLCGTAEGARGRLRRLLAVPRGAECTGPSFARGGRTLFVSVQHPGDGDGATFDAPRNRWPHGDPSRPPLPSVLVVERKDGRPIAG